jgi:ectoine hydroxylase-related dioxygenase (phytanoyl-CoA dioxygenase family)
MRFLPGSHHEEVRPHQLINPESADGLQLADGQPVRGSVACPLPAGGATVHSGRTLHYTGPNHTHEPRRAHIMAFRLPPIWDGTRTFAWQPARWQE